MSFIDEVVVELVSGKGGDGAATFHTEKFVPRGGPNGADGGRGGSIFLLADRGKRTLYDFSLKSRYRASDGVPARANKRGKDGESITLTVPVGTVVYDNEDGSQLADLATHGARFEVCRGGRGGRGNLHFVSSVRQAPKFAQNGAPAEAATVRLELKLLADVGVVGLPNAGKSTLLSAVSAAKPKVGAYPFTTLSPNLGVVSVGGKTFVMADLPGMIEGASEGVGLGHQFLRHAQRNKALLHVVDAFPIDGTDPLENFQTVETELSKYDDDLYRLPRIVALNKSDLAPADAVQEVAARFKDTGFPLYVCSAATNQGLEPLCFALLDLVEKAEVKLEAIPVLKADFTNTTDNDWSVDKVGDEYVVSGVRVEKLVAMTNLDNFDGVMYMYRRLRRIGVIDRLIELGAEEGDTVVVGDAEFTYTEW